MEINKLISELKELNLQLDVGKHFNNVFVKLANYHIEVITLIESEKLTLDAINKHDKLLNELHTDILVLLAIMGITDQDLHDLADNYATAQGLSDSVYYHEGDFLTRYSRIAQQELITVGLIPNPNYSKTLGTRTIYYSDIYRAWLRGELLDIFTNLVFLKLNIFSQKDKKKEFTFGLLVTIHIIIKTLNTEIEIEYES